MMKLRQVRQRKYDSSSSIQSNRPRPDRNWTVSRCFYLEY